MNFHIQFQHQQNTAAVEAATLKQGVEIERALFQSRQGGAVVAQQAHNLPVDGSTPSPDPISAGPQPAAFPGPHPRPVDGFHPHPPASHEIEQLVELFDTFGGFVPGFEFEALGLDIADLMLRRLIAPPMSHLDAGCYLIGSELRKAVHRG